MLFYKGLEGSAKELFDKLCAVDFDAAALHAELESGRYDADAVNDAAINYVDECEMNFDHWRIDWDHYYPGETIPGYESSHLVEAISLLLEYGLDPNRIYRENPEDEHGEEYNIMSLIHYVFNGYQAADSLYLLLSHGGDPNLVVERRRLIVDPDFDVMFDTVNREDMVSDSMYEAKLHYWLVLTGFGAVHENGQLPVDPVDGFDLSKLKEHRNYYAGAIHSDRTKEGWDLVVFDRHTNWEVGRL